MCIPNIGFNNIQGGYASAQQAKNGGYALI
jgi:hypothetical protein